MLRNGFVPWRQQAAGDIIPYEDLGLAWIMGGEYNLL